MEDAERRVQEYDQESDKNSVWLFLIGDTCVWTVQDKMPIVRLIVKNADTVAVIIANESKERELGTMAIVAAESMMGKLRSHANVDGWASRTAPKNQFEMIWKDISFSVVVTKFQLKPEILLEMEVTHVDGP